MDPNLEGSFGSITSSIASSSFTIDLRALRIIQSGPCLQQTQNVKKKKECRSPLIFLPMHTSMESTVRRRTTIFSENLCRSSASHSMRWRYVKFENRALISLSLALAIARSRSPQSTWDRLTRYDLKLIWISRAASCGDISFPFPLLLSAVLFAKAFRRQNHGWMMRKEDGQ